MAKKPTPTPTAAPPATPEVAPAQPWAKPAESAEIPTPDAPAAVDAPAPVADTQIPPASGDSEVVSPVPALPSEEHDQLTPSAPADAAHEQARSEALGGNGGGATADTAVPSELVDQHTPTGPGPEIVDKKAEALTPDAAPERVASEAKDQVSPIGEDLSSTIHEQIEAMDSDERAEFERAMTDTARTTLARIKRNREARAMELNMVDSQQHYGTRARAVPGQE